MRRVLPLRSGPPATEAGFLLPLATTGALVLLLSSLTLQTAVLQSRRLLVLQAHPCPDNGGEVRAAAVFYGTRTAHSASVLLISSAYQFSLHGRCR